LIRFKPISANEKSLKGINKCLFYEKSFAFVETQ
jgi:hypothetical protein